MRESLCTCVNLATTDECIHRTYIAKREAIADTKVMRGIPADAQIVVGRELDEPLAAFQGDWWFRVDPTTPMQNGSPRTRGGCSVRVYAPALEFANVTVSGEEQRFSGSTTHRQLRPRTHRLIFLKWTSPSGETVLFSDGLGTFVSEISPALIKLDLFFGVKILYQRGDQGDAAHAPIITVHVRGSIPLLL